jgi:hypothetical protein
MIESSSARPSSSIKNGYGPTSQTPPMTLNKNNTDRLMSSKSSYSLPSALFPSASSEVKCDRSQLLSSTSLNRPQSAPKLFEWQPKMYQSKSILQRRYEDRKQIGIINANMVDKKNSSFLHSSIAERMALGSPSIKSSSGNDRNIKNNNDKTVISSPKKGLAASMMKFARTGSSYSLNSEDTYKDRVLFLPKCKGDTLGTHHKNKKNRNKLSNNNASTVVSHPNQSHISYEFLDKTAHLTDEL